MNHLFTYSCFLTTGAELSGHFTCKTENVYYLALYRNICQCLVWMTYLIVGITLLTIRMNELKNLSYIYKDLSFG